jgi:hypothetical protein
MEMSEVARTIALSIGGSAVSADRSDADHRHGCTITKRRFAGDVTSFLLTGDSGPLEQCVPA